MLTFNIYTCSLLHAAPLFVLSAWCLTTRHLVTVNAALWGNKKKKIPCFHHFHMSKFQFIFLPHLIYFSFFFWFLKRTHQFHHMSKYLSQTASQSEQNTTLCPLSLYSYLEKQEKRKSNRGGIPLTTDRCNSCRSNVEKINNDIKLKVNMIWVTVQ